ncbi:MAG: SAM-dependent methyltransferase [Chloroflexaceae bacterium]|nr:SAM-dependent methyltransferase [Chloroflexaceae bacterium]
MTAVAGSAEVRKGRLFLVPMPLGDVSPAGALPPATVSVIVGLGHFVAESARTARRFLTQLPLSAPVQSLVIEELNEHTPPAAVHALLAPLLAGHDVGLVSEAGCPVVADPGSNLVRAAHAAGIPVTPLVGPSAPLLALMASGLGGQAFRFAGYLPQDAPARRTAILERQKEARQGVTQIFIETPYRNEALLKGEDGMLTVDQIITHVEQVIAEDRLSGNAEGLRRTQLGLTLLMGAAKSAGDKELARRFQALAAMAANKQEELGAED